uniref:Uncharacterized protein n=1 Tax=Ciona savignyi TaxID=51511 RepID=H2Z7G0_CIOSA
MEAISVYIQSPVLYNCLNPLRDWPRKTSPSMRRLPTLNALEIGLKLAALESLFFSRSQSAYLGEVEILVVYPTRVFSVHDHLSSPTHHFPILSSSILHRHRLLDVFLCDGVADRGGDDVGHGGGRDETFYFHDDDGVGDDVDGVVLNQHLHFFDVVFGAEANWAVWI